MVTGSRTSQPIGHYEFCQRAASECAIKPVDQSMHPASLAFLEELDVLTKAVNTQVKPVSDEELYGQEEYWTYPTEAGDCEDYALEKQRILSQRGVSRANLLITVVRRPGGDGHAVLTVRTNGGDFILDNLDDGVKAWDETEYTYLKRQASAHSGKWVDIEEGHSEPLVSSIR
jgi:predicted transglutaminase-like cysteine proteinase